MLRAIQKAGVLGASRCKAPPLGPWCSRLISGLGTTMPSPKSLDDILKLDTLADKSPEEIEAIWMQVPACQWQQLAAPMGPRATAIIRALQVPLYPSF